MNITRAKQYVLDTVRAYLQTDDDGMRVIEPRLQRPLFLIGPPGIGKTAIMSQVASELGIGMIAYSMTHHTRQSALGLPVIQHQSYGDFEYDASEYTMSEIIASIYSFMRRTGLEQGILFLDEVNCVSETLYPSMLQFLQFKTFGAHAVPDGWVIVCAGNPPEYNRSVHEFDVATMDRLRKISIEPEYEAWKPYAANAGVHAAVTTFLETQPDYFYRIESKPGQKSFVTARGWDDLARMISANELMDIPVEQDLVEQFVQDDEIAEKFSMYYELFRKYQSDYQVPSILAGTHDGQIVERATAARLDERMALLGLIVDALLPHADDVMLQEGVLVEVRDALRGVKGAFVAGASVEAELDPLVEASRQREQQLEAMGAHNVDELRRARRVTGVLKACRNACVQAGCDAGEAAFEAIHQEFRGYSGAFEADVASLRSQMDNAFSFLDEAFGEGRETTMFTTELVARRSTALFAARYGCEGFTKHNQELQVGAKRDDLLARIEEAKAAEAAGAGGASEAADAAGVAETIGAAGAAGTAEAVDTAGATGVADAAEAVNAPAGAVPSGDGLEAYYRNAKWEYGYASLCHMALPSGLAGKTVLDVGCRRGKGVFKLSERVGARGHAIGVDWVPEHVNEAAARSDRAARETGLPVNNMEFHLVYPEDLMQAGIGTGTVDVAFVNSVVHLTCNPAQVLAELRRVLKPSGLLVCEVALATGPRDVEAVEAARALGNSIQAAPWRQDFERHLADLGFELEVVEQPKPVEPDQGFKRGHEVPTAPTSEAVGFEALVLHAVVKR